MNVKTYSNGSTNQAMPTDAVLRGRIAELQAEIERLRTRVAELEAENARLQRDADSRIIQEVKRQIESRQGKCILVARGTLELLIEERCEEIKTALARLVKAGVSLASSIDGPLAFHRKLTIHEKLALEEMDAALDAARAVMGNER